MHPSTPSVHPRQSKNQFYRTFLLDGRDLEVEVVYLVVLDSLLRATTKKVVNFVRKKCTPD